MAATTGEAAANLVSGGKIYAQGVLAPHTRSLKSKKSRGIPNGIQIQLWNDPRELAENVHYTPHLARLIGSNKRVHISTPDGKDS